MIKKEDIHKCFPIPNELQLWYGDNYIYHKLDKDIGFTNEFIYHFESKTLFSTERMNKNIEIIENDKKERAKLVVKL